MLSEQEEFLLREGWLDNADGEWGHTHYLDDEGRMIPLPKEQALAVARYGVTKKQKAMIQAASFVKRRGLPATGTLLERRATS